MATDSLQPTWLKPLAGIVTAIVADENTGNIWVGDASGKLTRFTGNGVASEPIQLDNSIYSLGIDKNTGDVYVGDSANNVFKYTSSGELKWGKNLGAGNTDGIPLVSTINNMDPDENGNIDLTSLYYSQNQIKELLAPLGKTKSWNGIKPDESGNITFDFGSFFTYKGVENAGSNLDKVLESGWYVVKSASGVNSTLFVYSNNDSIMQILAGSDNTVSMRSKKGQTNFTPWKLMTNAVFSVNNIKPDSNGNVNLDTTGSVKTVNNQKPDKDGNIQLGIGGKNTAKSINKVNKPDDTGDIKVPTFAPNLLKGTSNKKTQVPVNSSVAGELNQWASNPIANSTPDAKTGVISTGKPVTAGAEGAMLVKDVKVQPLKSYIYSIWLSVPEKAVDMSGVKVASSYSEWRPLTVKVYFVFKDVNNNVLNQPQQFVTYTFDQQNKNNLYNITGKITVPKETSTVSLWYNGLEQTDDNIVIGEDALGIAGASHVNSQDQTVDLPKMSLSQDITNKRVAIKIQARVTNYKSGTFLSLKTKDLTSSKFKTDSDKLDSSKTLITPVTAVNTEENITGNGMYSWEFALNGSDLVGTDTKTIIPITDVIGNVDYTIKIVPWETEAEKPDLVWSTAPTVDDDGNKTYNTTAYNNMLFFNSSLYIDESTNIVNLGAYNIGNDYITLDDTVGLYQASASVDMGNSNGYCYLVLSKVDSTGKVIAQATSNSLPIYTPLANGEDFIIDKSSVLKTDPVDNQKPTSTDKIKLDLYIVGQTDVITVSQYKIAQWKDDGNTPPDLTWLPYVEDGLGGVKDVNGYAPDEQGHINILKLLSSLQSITEDGVQKVYKGEKNLNPDTIVLSGVYRVSNCKINGTYTSTNRGVNNPLSFAGSYWGLIFNFNFDGTATSNAVYQIMLLNEGIYYRTLSVQQSKFPPFSTPAFAQDIADINKTIASLGQVKTINKKAPDSNGDFTLPSFDNPDYTYVKGQTIDVDTTTTSGIHHLMDATVIASVNPSCLGGIYGNADGVTKTGYLVVYKHDINNLTQVLVVYTGSATPDLTFYTRSVSIGTPRYRPTFRRVLNIDDYTDLDGRVKGTASDLTTFKNNTTNMVTQLHNDIVSTQNRTTTLETKITNTDNRVSAISDTLNNGNLLQSWTGTIDEYKALSNHDPMTIYFIMSGYKVVVD